MEDSVIVPVLGVMVPIVAIIGLFMMLVYLRRFENAERMAMIEKGVDPQLFNIRKPRVTSGALRASLLMIGGGVGLLLGRLLDSVWDMNHVGYLSMLFICGGVGLGAAYLVEEKKIKQEKEEKGR